MKGYFESRGFKLTHMNPCMLYGIGMIEIIYVDDVLFFGTNQDKIDEFIKELENSGILLNIEEDLYAFLGVEVKTDNQSGKVTLTQG